MEEWKDAYFVKYALTDGIQEVKSRPYGDYFKVEGYNGLFSKNDVFFSRKEAVAEVMNLKEKKISSLEKQIKKLNKLVIT